MNRLAFLQTHLAFRIMFHEIIVNLLSPGRSLDPPHISMIVHNTNIKKYINDKHENLDKIISQKNGGK